MATAALDIHLGAVLIVGGVIGTVLGVMFFNQMRRLGFLDLIITLSYVTLLMSIGCLMFVESIGAMIENRKSAQRAVAREPPPEKAWHQRFPFHRHFARSKLTTSVIPVVASALSSVSSAQCSVLAAGSWWCRR